MASSCDLCNRIPLACNQSIQYHVTDPQEPLQHWLTWLACAVAVCWPPPEPQYWITSGELIIQAKPTHFPSVLPCVFDLDRYGESMK